MICTTYFLTFFSELIPPTGYNLSPPYFKGTCSKVATKNS